MTSTHPRLKISYAICVKDETQSLEDLLDAIKLHKDDIDEIVIINDFATNEVTKKQLLRADTLVSKKLLGDYASHKNLFFDICKGDYIFNIDADEIPSSKLLKQLKVILKTNPNIELFALPRRNYITGITPKIIKEWGCREERDGRLNFPDYQGRIYKNSKRLSWVGSVHEQIHGHRGMKKLSETSGHFLTHTKELQKQIRNNLKYRELKKKLVSDSGVGIVCCYFNPCNYTSKFINFIKFIDHLKSCGVTPLVVEAYTDSSSYRINNFSDNTLSLKCNSVYWQKESLLNAGITHLLKENYEYIMWVDADIEFLTNDWLEHITRSVEFYGVSQIFKKSTKDITQCLENEKMSTCYYFTGNSRTDLDGILARRGEPGYGYCYHRSFLEQNLLFDKAIVGAGDIANLLGMYCNPDNLELIKNDRFFINTTHDFFNSFKEWSLRNKQLQYGVGYANVEIKVHPHGTIKNRKYRIRENIIKKCAFNPTHDLIKTNTGLYELTNTKLEKAIKMYFSERDEDSHLTPAEITNTDMVYQMSTTKNLKFVKETTHSLISNYTPRKLKNFKLNKNSNHVIVVGKCSEKKFSIERVSSKCKLVVDTSGRPSINSHTHSAGVGIYGIYLSFIVMFYKELPEYCIFVNEGIGNKDYVRILNNVIDNISEVRSIQPIVGEYTKIAIDQHTIVKNYKSMRIWWKENTKHEYDHKRMYLKSGNFVVTRNEIYKHPVNYYSQILNNMKRSIEGEEFMVSRAFPHLLK